MRVKPPASLSTTNESSRGTKQGHTIRGPHQHSRRERRKGETEKKGGGAEKNTYDALDFNLAANRRKPVLARKRARVARVNIAATNRLYRVPDGGKRVAVRLRALRRMRQTN